MSNVSHGMARMDARCSRSVSGRLICDVATAAVRSCEKFLYVFKAARPGRSRRRLGGLASAPAGAPAVAGLTPVGWREGAEAGPPKRRRSSPGPQFGWARSWLPLRHCPGRAEPVKSACGVGYADLRLLTEPVRSPGVRSYREPGGGLHHRVWWRCAFASRHRRLSSTGPVIPGQRTNAAGTPRASLAVRWQQLALWPTPPGLPVRAGNRRSSALSAHARHPTCSLSRPTGAALVLPPLCVPMP